MKALYPNCEKHGHLIKKNPGKSKHLETAVVNIFDYSIDLVNLRTESFADDSRIPSIVMK